jgi:hypothetical protein
MSVPLLVAVKLMRISIPINLLTILSVAILLLYFISRNKDKGRDFHSVFTVVMLSVAVFCLGIDGVGINHFFVSILHCH